MPRASYWFDQTPDQLRFPKLDKAAAADVATGDTGFTTAFITRVLEGPARRAQRSYPVKAEGNNLFVQL